MSEKEMKRRRMLSNIFIEAWRLKKKTCLITLSFGTSLKLAWMLLRSKLKIYHTKAVGVTFEGRQNTLHILQSYSLENIILYLKRDKENPYDNNAIQVLAQVKGRGHGVIGYVNRDLASSIAPLLDAGKNSVAILNDITGGNGNFFGCNFSFILY